MMETDMSMPIGVKIFPRGYSGGQSRAQPTHNTRGGDPEVVALWERYTRQETNDSKTWAFRRDVLATARRLLAGKPNWFLCQDTNPRVLEYSYEFLVDTLRFLAYGQRRMSIHMWPDLVSNHPADGLADVSDRHRLSDLFNEMRLSTSIETMLQLWCSHPGGFDDLMCTLNILFGDLPLRVDPTQRSEKE